MDTLELFAHPVRLRIVHALQGGRLLTTNQLRDRIPEASKATVYRHVELLAEGGILEVAGEQRVRGATERTYRLRQPLMPIDVNTIRSLTLDDHREAFAAAMAALLAEFNAYLERGQADPAEDMVGYRQHAVWMSEEERDRLIAGMREAILPVLANKPAEGRSQYLLSPILFPMEERNG